MKFIYVLIISLLLYLYINNNPSIIKFGGNNLIYNMPMIYVINLDKRPERWESVHKQLEYQNLQHIRFSAVDGTTITDIDKKKYVSDEGLKEKQFGLSLSNGGIGLGITFYKLLLLSIETHKDIIIMEDDITLHDNFKNNFMNIIQHLKDIDYDIVYIGYHKITDKSQIQIINKYISKSKPGTQLNGTFGLFIPYNKCKKILDEMYPLRWQIDTELYMTNLNRYIVNTPLLSSPPSDLTNSDIQEF